MRFFSQEWALVCLKAPRLRTPCLAKTYLVVCCLFTAMSALILAIPSYVYAQDQPASASAQVTKTVGVIKTIQPDSITIAAEAGGEITATLTSTTKILR